MKQNEGFLDRAIRVLAGLFIIWLGYTYYSIWGALGLIPLITGLVGFCPLYALMGISTCKK